jgi:hypothetical protein
MNTRTERSRSKALRHTRTWTFEEIDRLRRCRLLAFDSKGQDWRPQDPARTVQAAETQQPEAVQLECFLEWTGLSTHQWLSRIWHECMVMCHKQGKRSAKYALPRSLRQRLDALANDVGPARSGEYPVPEDEIREIVSSTGEPAFTGEIHSTLAIEYFAAVRTGSLEQHEWLNAPLVESPMLRQWAELGSPRELSLRQGPDETEVGRFLKYIAIRSDDPLYPLARVISVILQFRPRQLMLAPGQLPKGLHAICPPVLDPQGQYPPKEAIRILRRYSGCLELPAGFASHVILSLVMMRLRNVLRERGPSLLPVFWAAYILRHVFPPIFAEYRKWTTVIRRELRSRYGTKVHKHRDMHRVAALVKPIRDALMGDALLNCVFHSEVLNGDAHLTRPSKRRGHPSDEVRGVMTSWLVRRLSESPVVRTKRVEEVVGPAHRLRTKFESIRCTLRDCASRRGVNAHAAFLIVALFPEEVGGATPATINKLAHKYSDHPLVDTLNSDPRQVFRDALDRL